MSQENDWWIEHHFGSGTIEAPSEKKYIYESPDKGKTIYRREFGKLDRELVSQPKQG